MVPNVDYKTSKENKLLVKEIDYQGGTARLLRMEERKLQIWKNLRIQKVTSLIREPVYMVGNSMSQYLTMKYYEKLITKNELWSTNELVKERERLNKGNEKKSQKKP